MLSTLMFPCLQKSLLIIITHPLNIKLHDLILTDILERKGNQKYKNGKMGINS